MAQAKRELGRSRMRWARAVGAFAIAADLEFLEVRAACADPRAGCASTTRPQSSRAANTARWSSLARSRRACCIEILKKPVSVGVDEIEAMPKRRPVHEFTPLADEQIELIKQWIDQSAK